jgi:hypothetical protein
VNRFHLSHHISPFLIIPSPSNISQKPNFPIQLIPNSFPPPPFKCFFSHSRTLIVEIAGSRCPKRQHFHSSIRRPLQLHGKGHRRVEDDAGDCWGGGRRQSEARPEGRRGGGGRKQPQGWRRRRGGQGQVIQLLSLVAIAGTRQCAGDTRELGGHRREWHHRLGRRVQRTLGAQAAAHLHRGHSPGHGAVPNFVRKQQRRAQAEPGGEVLAEQLGNRLRIPMALEVE